MVKIEVNYRVKTPQKYEALFIRLGRRSLSILQLGRLEVSVALVGPAEIAKLNRRYRGLNQATDVLSFEEINEIVICFSQARRQAKEKEHSVKTEIGFLFVHGLLHLLGFNHQTKSQADRMFALTKRILMKG